MFTLGILISIYAYIIFILGQLNLLYTWSIVFSLLMYLAGVWYLITHHIEREKNIEFFSFFQKLKKEFRHRFDFLLLCLVIVQGVVNLVGVFGPETAFDALWYHLTLPKLYLASHSIFHIPGGLLYYSDMPRMTEMLYVAALSFQGETLAKFIHFMFGIVTMIGIYQVSKKYFSITVSLLSVLVFSSNLVFSWESTTAYVDLTRTFFEFLAFWGFLNWLDTKKISWFVESAVMLGLAICTKLLAASSIIIFILLILLYRKNFPQGKNVLIYIMIYSSVASVIPLPWFITSFLNTGNPFYPFFTNIYPTLLSISLLNPVKFINDIFSILLQAADPINPIYIIALPITLLLYKRMNKGIQVMTIYLFLSLLIWYITPRTGGGRFLLPYLPVYSILVGGIIYTLREKTHFELISKKIICFVIVFIAMITIIYRGIAVSKNIPVVLGYQTKEKFLRENLNFSFGDFYDVDGYFAHHISANDKVLLYGFHNLYYVNFPFIDSSWVKKGDTFSYIATQHAALPMQFSHWTAIYHNETTDVTLYKNGDRLWMY